MRRLAVALLLLVGCSMPGLPREPAVTASGSGTSHSSPFTLAGGSYKVDWTLTDTHPGLLPCGHGARLASTTNERLSYPLGAGNVPSGEQTATGTTWAYSVAAGTYYVDVLANCTWSFVLTQQ